MKGDIRISRALNGKDYFIDRMPENKHCRLRRVNYDCVCTIRSKFLDPFNV